MATEEEIAYGEMQAQVHAPLLNARNARIFYAFFPCNTE
jgi:hypothetical protein